MSGEGVTMKSILVGILLAAAASAWAEDQTTAFGRPERQATSTKPGSAASRRGAGPNTTCASARGSYSELWHGHLRMVLPLHSPFTHSETGHPACEQIAE